MLQREGKKTQKQVEIKLCNESLDCLNGVIGEMMQDVAKVSLCSKSRPSLRIWTRTLLQKGLIAQGTSLFSNTISD